MKPPSNNYHSNSSENTKSTTNKYQSTLSSIKSQEHSLQIWQSSS